MKLSSAEQSASSSICSKRSSSGDDTGCVADEERSNSDRNVNLQDSEFSTDSLINGGEGSGMGWFGGIGTDFLHCLTDNVSPVVSGVATLVHKTAVAVANEISQLERDGELQAEAAAAERFIEHCDEIEKSAADYNSTNFLSSPSLSTKEKSESLILPWEICRESVQNPTFERGDDNIPVYVTDRDLMKKIFALSSQESTFIHPFSDQSPDGNPMQTRRASSFCSTFVMDEQRIKLVQRLLDIDKNLAHFHSNMKGRASKSSETFFWMNYFFHCERVRTDEFRKRQKQNETSKSKKKSSSQIDEETSMSRSTSIKSNNNSAKHDGDDESLVAVDSDFEGRQHDDSSYVIQSAPNTGDTVATSRSIDDDLVIVDTYERMIAHK